MSDGQNYLGECEVAEYYVIALRGAHSLYIPWDCGYTCLSVHTHVIASGGAHIAFHGFLISATTRVHRSTGLDNTYFWQELTWVLQRIRYEMLLRGLAGAAARRILIHNEAGRGRREFFSGPATNSQ